MNNNPLTKSNIRFIDVKTFEEYNLEKNIKKLEEKEEEK